MQQDTRPPELAISSWLNTSEPLPLAGLIGRPVLIHAFQMLCPGCVVHAIPQSQKAHQIFRDSDLQVIGLHSVFEHHAAMSPIALEAFVHEYGLTFPIGIDEAGTDTPLPVTMERYRMRGTPTTILIGRDGRLLSHQFGRIDDMMLGALIAFALAGKSGTLSAGADRRSVVGEPGCSDDACVTL